MKRPKPKKSAAGKKAGPLRSFTLHFTGLAPRRIDAASKSAAEQHGRTIAPQSFAFVTIDR